LGIAHGGGVWNERHLASFDVMKFRGDNVYVWQTRIFQEIHYFVSYLYALKVDKLGLHNRFIEEGSFGVETFSFEGRSVSRDLIDSMIEISYLEEKLQMSNTKGFRILDIGAGYGRFAKRIQEGFNNIEVACIDAIPLSTCLSKVYLEDEIRTGKVTVHQLDTLDEVQEGSINLAINIHSFSEMSMPSVESWVRFLVEKKIENIFIVPNGQNLALNDGSDFSGLFENAGYHIESVDDKFSDPEFARFGIYPSKHFLLRRSFS
jgi:SAM-dependent methyltransferase